MQNKQLYEVNQFYSDILDSFERLSLHIQRVFSDTEELLQRIDILLYENRRLLDERQLDSSGSSSVSQLNMLDDPFEGLVNVGVKNG